MTRFLRLLCWIHIHDWVHEPPIRITPEAFLYRIVCRRCGKRETLTMKY